MGAGHGVGLAVWHGIYGLGHLGVIFKDVFHLFLAVGVSKSRVDKL